MITINPNESPPRCVKALRAHYCSKQWSSQVDHTKAIFEAKIGCSHKEIQSFFRPLDQLPTHTRYQQNDHME